ncbi:MULTISPECIES: DUF3575 domain-containing protein [Mediterranea]|uniref:DUF3575 domain-containing protein n=1 Tax=Mediterranea TaxID=1926659 RepID=UPI0003377953|nr:MULTISPECIES: DUF3575 domain-containing protein [Mediterranea]MCL1608029.1 DUF3575 domain-containing protein [Mediterranea sp. ET5]MDM8122865.1 DUF3575 domain-containing protein [Mediterranea massiliensis]MDM8199068.1 DUF3575 domain-containing protein [Mediterranea massiliensis]CDD83871.1 putative uncharacterized protein [Bacteroides sp. CAG:462]
MILVALTLFIWGIQTASAQTWGIKTNALYDATRTVNIGTEFALCKKWTLDVSGNYNGWNAGSRCEKMKHFMVQPELRYWTCDVFNGHFFALHAMGGGYNISNVRFPFFTRKFDDGNRYEGWFVGAGVGYGYSWVLGKRWNLEAEIGAGYAYSPYDSYECLECRRSLDSGTRHYWGITKAAISLIYFLK